MGGHGGRIPDGDVDIAPVAALFADTSRARMLLALLAGVPMPASRLAREAGISPATASEHLGRLLAGGLVEVEPAGRQRLYRLSGPRVAAALEALTPLAAPVVTSSLRGSGRAARLREARTCYDHLAGRLGVLVTEALVTAEALVPREGARTAAGRPGGVRAGRLAELPYELGPSAGGVLAEWGVTLAEVSAAARPALGFCVDWTERRHHLAGGLGAALLAGMRSRSWLVAGPRPRELRLTPAGAAGLERLRVGL